MLDQLSKLFILLKFGVITKDDNNPPTVTCSLLYSIISWKSQKYLDSLEEK
jgi:hypothetical protein